MKSRVFSLFTFQMASQFPKRDNHSAEHVRSVVITTNHQHVLTTSSRMLYHGSWVIWVMGQYSVGHMGHGSLEVTHRLPCNPNTVYSDNVPCLFLNLLVTSQSTVYTTNSSAVAKRLRDASYLSVVSFNRTKHRAQSFILRYI